MTNLARFKRSIDGKPDWDKNDWIAFVDALYADTKQDIRIKDVVDRIDYDGRKPTPNEVQRLLSFIKIIYTENNASIGLINDLSARIPKFEVARLTRIIAGLAAFPNIP